MVLMIGLHSQLEYPLWYAHFLLPAAWAWGFGLASQGHARPYARSFARSYANSPLGSPVLAVFGTVLVAGAALSVFDYMRVAAIFSAPEDAPPLEQRILLGQRSVFFSHHADYAAATTAGVADHSLAPFAGAAHYLLDTRLMMAWARALEVNGRDDQARHIAQRLREFHNPQSDEFFAACKSVGSGAFQCQPPRHEMGWRALVQ